MANAKATKVVAQRVREQTNHYDVLGVSPRASAAAIREAHRALASLFHPDRCDLPDAQDLMAKVNVAYTTLSDAEARRKYDLINHTAKRAVCPMCKGTGKVAGQQGFKRVMRICTMCAGSGKA